MRLVGTFLENNGRYFFYIFHLSANSCSNDHLYFFAKMSLSRLLCTFYDSWILAHIWLQKLRFWFTENTFEMYLFFRDHICHCSMFSTTSYVAAMARWLLDVGPGWLQQHHWCSHWRGKTLATRHHFVQWVSTHKNLNQAKRLHARFRTGDEHESSQSAVHFTIPSGRLQLQLFFSFLAWVTYLG